MTAYIVAMVMCCPATTDALQRIVERLAGAIRGTAFNRVCGSLQPEARPIEHYPKFKQSVSGRAASARKKGAPHE